MSERVDPPVSGPERDQVMGYLDYQRATLRMKVAGLTDAQLAATLAPSDLTLGGMVKHLALVEQAWSNRFAGRGYEAPWADVDWEADPDWDWHSAAHDTAADLMALLDAEIARADAIYAGAALDALAEKPMRDGDHASQRWILLHLIEEYARHNGHADLIRQSIDGAVGE